MATPASGLHSLATIIKRLEAATSRIEDVVATQGTLSAQPAVTQAKEGGVASNTAPPPPPPPPPPPSPPAPASVIQEIPKAVAAYDEQIVEGKVKVFVKLSNDFGSPSVTELAGLFEKQYTALRSFLLLAATCQKPEQHALGDLVGELYATIGETSKAKESYRKDREWYTHLTLISEAGPALGWVENPKPAPYIGQFKDTVDYYANKLIQEYKSKDIKHVEWARSFTAVLDTLQKYVKEHHTTGLVWNAQGVSYDQYNASLSGAAAPPPDPAEGSAPGGASALLAELNKGENITKNLRKVDKSEMTHKNPALRAGNTVPASTPSTSPAGKKPIKPTKPSALAGKKPPKFNLEVSKWLIEYQENESALTVENTEINQSVNIFGCKNTTIIIKGKVNAVSILNSVKTSVLVESVVSSVSITSSPSFALQVTGSAPMIQIDSTDSGQIYLSKASLGAEITTAKCSAINISLPVEGEEDGVFEEQPIPEMLKTVVKNGKLVTSTVEHTA